MVVAMEHDFTDLGDARWDAALEAFPEMQKVTLDRAAKLLVMGLKANIARQGPEGVDWPPIKMSTLARKLAREEPPSQFPTDVWRDTGALFSLLSFRGYGEGLDYAVGVGLFENSGDRAEAAIRLEYGAGPVAARPLFRPTLVQQEGELVASMEYSIRQVLDDIDRGRSP